MTKENNDGGSSNNDINSITSALRTQHLAQSNQSFDLVSQSYLQIISNLAAKLEELQKENTLLKSTQKTRVVRTKRNVRSGKQTR